jgi:hypothetical protein
MEMSETDKEPTKFDTPYLNQLLAEIKKHRERQPALANSLPNQLALPVHSNVSFLAIHAKSSSTVRQPAIRENTYAPSRMGLAALTQRRKLATCRT